MIISNPVTGLGVSEMRMPDRIRNLLKELNVGIYERERAMAMSLLATLSGQSVFLYGPPGTAKSLVARRISCAFSDAVYFEYLMQRFSTPEEVFGPISISELKKDNYIRKTKGYLPTSDIAFLDEIWKSSPAILNTLLTIINERRFRNGGTVENVPLKAIIAASNEFPRENSGLDALYDRFIVRLVVEPMRLKSNFERMISSDVPSFIEVSEPIGMEEWVRIRKESAKVMIPKDVMDLIDGIRYRIEKNNKAQEKKIYISDRRWQKAMAMLRTAAYLSGRKTVCNKDCYILINCIWSNLDDLETIKEIVSEEVYESESSLTDEIKSWNESFAAFKTSYENRKNKSSQVTDVLYSKDIRTMNGEKYVFINTDRYREVKIQISNRYKGYRSMPNMYDNYGRNISIYYSFTEYSNDYVELWVDGRTIKIYPTKVCSIEDEQTISAVIDSLLCKLDQLIESARSEAINLHSDSVFITKEDLKEMRAPFKKTLSQLEASKETLMKYKEENNGIR